MAIEVTRMMTTAEEPAVGFVADNVLVATGSPPCVFRTGIATRTGEGDPTLLPCRFGLFCRKRVRR